jgi:hypothetical protein
VTTFQETPPDELNLDHYLGLLDLAYEVAQVLRGTTPPNPWIADCQQLAAKLFFHAATIYCLRQNGTKCPVPTSMEGGSFFYDHASVPIIARSALETYLEMFEVFFEPATDDERNFRHAHWLLSGLIVREGFLPGEPVPPNQVFRSQQEIEELRERIRNTQAFASLSHSQQRQVLRGRSTRHLAERARAAGFSEGYWSIVYPYLSAYAHADGLSGIQIMGAETREEQIRFIDSSMHVAVMPSLSKMILSYADSFHESEAVCNAKPDAFHWANVYSEVARRMKLSRAVFSEA